MKRAGQNRSCSPILLLVVQVRRQIVERIGPAAVHCTYRRADRRIRAGGRSFGAVALFGEIQRHDRGV
ncbi:hypothetical protein [Paenibacillus sp. YSY-4.3]